mmetsp:Transcript_53515/g.125560  ORF Transcript_53515/g.125560 Transcript_53515/m.125560 type:complete len:786 (+) Transcript_53515:21-2378(+)|eukprot:s413_g10.t2
MSKTASTGGEPPENDEAMATAPTPKAKESKVKKTPKARTEADTGLGNTVQAQAKQLAAQAEQLEAQSQQLSTQAELLSRQDLRIQQLEQRLERLLEQGARSVVAEVMEDVQANDVVEVKLVAAPQADEDEMHDGVALYEFDQSIWDAALLLFFNNATTPVDRAVLIVGFLLNLALQIALLLTVTMILLENPYTHQTVKEMLTWRVGAHTTANFDDTAGKSLLRRLCNQELWSYEQAEFKLMYDYLYQVVPGYILSSLAIIMWILTVMVEFRRCTEQALAVIHLPAISPQQSAAVHHRDGRIAIQGIQPTKRCLALIMLSLPRIAVMLWMALFGCQYLAQTVSLENIVLNAVGLAFIMDVDELIAHVLLTEQLRSMLPRIEAMRCGESSGKSGKSLCPPLKDVTRYVITTGLIILAFNLWLVPFDANVRGAAMALCGGFQDFSFEGGVAENAPIILMPASFGQDAWVTDCGGTTTNGTVQDDYLQRYYGVRYNASVKNRIKSATGDDYQKLRMKNVLQFAYANSPDFGDAQSCGSDSALGPQDKDSKQRACVKLPPSLSTALEAENVTHKSVPENCPRFNATDGCVSLTNPEACLWTWLAKKCDGSPSGEVQWQACDSQSDVNTKCDTWEYVFKKAHPEINCIARYYCTSPNFNCLALRAQYLVKPSSWNTFSADNSDFVNAFRYVLVDWSGIDQSHVTVHMSEAGSSHPSGTALATLCLRNMPLEYKPETNVTGSSLLAAIRQSDAYNRSNGIESLTVLSEELEYLSTNDLNTQPWKCDPSSAVD